MDHVGGDWADRLLGLHGVRADIAVVRTPGIPRLTFAQYGSIYRYCYVRGLGDVVIELVEELS